MALSQGNSLQSEVVLMRVKYSLNARHHKILTGTSLDVKSARHERRKAEKLAQLEKKKEKIVDK